MRNKLVKLIFSTTLLFGVVFSSQAFAEAGFPKPPIGYFVEDQSTVSTTETDKDNKMGFPKPPIGDELN